MIIVSDNNRITGQKIFIDGAGVEESTLKQSLEVKADPVEDYYSKRDLWENEGAYADDSNED